MNMFSWHYTYIAHLLQTRHSLCIYIISMSKPNGLVYHPEIKINKLSVPSQPSTPSSSPLLHNLPTHFPCPHTTTRQDSSVPNFHSTPTNHSASPSHSPARPPHSTPRSRLPKPHIPRSPTPLPTHIPRPRRQSALLGLLSSLLLLEWWCGWIHFQGTRNHVFVLACVFEGSCLGEGLIG